MERFTLISIEVCTSIANRSKESEWVDLTPDVLATPAPKASRGIMTPAPIQYLAQPGTLSFSLNNSKNNSQGKEGYYSPGHTNAPHYWKVGAPVRVIFHYDTWHFVKWQGFIDIDGIRVYPGERSTRRVDVKCTDYLGIMRDHKLNLLAPAVNKNTQQAIELILRNLDIQPQATDYNITSATMAYLFDNAGPDTTALSEINKIATSQRIFIFMRGSNIDTGEILQVGVPADSQPGSFPLATQFSGKLLLETGDGLLLEDGTSYLLLDEIWVGGDPDDITYTEDHFKEGTNISYGRYIYNYVTVTSYPRRVDSAATTVLWRLEKATQLAAGQSVTFRAQYRDPDGGNNKIGGAEFVNPVSGTDYAAFTNENGTGTNMTANMNVSVTFGATEAEITVTNTHGSTAFWFGGPNITFQLRGKGIYLYDPVRVVVSNDDSIATYGVHALSIDMRYQEAPTGKLDIGQGIVNTHKDPRYEFERAVFIANDSPQLMSVFMFGEPFKQLRLASSVAGISASTWRIHGWEFEILDKKIVRVAFVMRHIF